MPGILGIVSTEDPRQRESTLRTLLKPLARLDSHRSEVLAMDHAALGVVVRGDQRRLHENDRFALIYHGEIVDAPGLRDRLLRAGEVVARETAMVDLLAGLFNHFGPQGLAGLNGQYTAAVWEKSDRRLTLVNDRVGICRLYYWQMGDGIVFASEMRSIEAHPRFCRRLNEIALADYLGVGTYQEEHTMIEGIYNLQSAGIATFQDGSLSLKRYWTPHYHMEGERIPPMDEVMEELASRIRLAVRRRIRPNALLLLTGGLDSRSLAAAWREEAPDVPLTTATIGKPDGDDVRIAKKISRKLGFRHEIIPLDDTYVEKYASRSVWKSEGNQKTQSCFIYAVEPYLVQNGFSTILTGVVGDVFTGRAWYDIILNAKSHDELCDQIRNGKRYHLWLQQRVLRQEVRQRLGDVTIDGFRRSLGNCKGGSVFYDHESYILNTHYHRWTMTEDVFNDVAEILDPFWDPDLMDYLIGLPVSIRKDGNFYRKTIIRHFPRVAGVEYLYSKSLRSYVREKESPAYEFLAKSFRRVRNRLHPLPPYYMGDHPDLSIPVNQAPRCGSRAFVEELMSNANELEPWLDLAAVRDVVNEYLCSDNQAFRPVGVLLALLLWGRLFMSEN